MDTDKILNFSKCILRSNSEEEEENKNRNDENQPMAMPQILKLLCLHIRNFQTHLLLQVMMMLIVVRMMILIFIENLKIEQQLSSISALTTILKYFSILCLMTVYGQ